MWLSRFQQQKYLYNNVTKQQHCLFNSPIKHFDVY